MMRQGTMVLGHTVYSGVIFTNEDAADASLSTEDDDDRDDALCCEPPEKRARPFFFIFSTVACDTSVKELVLEFIRIFTKIASI